MDKKPKDSSTASGRAGGAIELFVNYERAPDGTVKWQFRWTAAVYVICAVAVGWVALQTIPTIINALNPAKAVPPAIEASAPP